MDHIINIWSLLPNKILLPLAFWRIQENIMFSVCLSTTWGDGIPSLWSQVLFWCPRSFLGELPQSLVLGPFIGLWSQVIARGKGCRSRACRGWGGNQVSRVAGGALSWSVVPHHRKPGQMYGTGIVPLAFMQEDLLLKCSECVQTSKIYASNHTLTDC